jgi:hypothetical protein
MLVQERMQHLMELVDRGASLQEIQTAEAELADAIKQAPFEIKEQFRLIKDMAENVDSRKAFQQFRLNDGRTVMDRREQFMGRPAEPSKESAKEAAKEATREAVKEGAERASKDAAKESAKESAAKSGVRAAGLKLTDSLEQGAATKRVDEMLTKFERLVLERFEKGAEVAKRSADGKPHYAGKSDGDWKAFFKNFLDRTVARKALVDDIKQFFMRGAVAKGAKGIFIGDMQFQNGRVEKFVRFSVLAEALAKLRAMMPGSSITKEMLQKLSGEELMYLALAASKGREFAYSQEAARGRFGLASAEARAAEALGLPLDQQLAKKAKQLKGRKGGRGTAWYDKDAEPEELPYRFVPWWQWGNLNNPGPTKWVTRAFYGALFIVSMIGIVVLTLRLLAGG